MTVYLQNNVSFLFLNIYVNLQLEAADTHPLVDFWPTSFISHTANPHSSWLANGSHDTFPSNCCLCCKNLKAVFSGLNASPAASGNSSIYHLWLSSSSSSSSTLALWLGVPWHGSRGGTKLLLSSKQGSCEFVLTFERNPIFTNYTVLPPF